MAFDVKGHAFFMEDGTETANYITGNLGINIRLSSSLLGSDQKPAIFWTATPDNFWRDNVACHSANFGHWFEFPGSVGQADNEPITCPFGKDLGEFRNNTYHSNGAMGLRVYPGWNPHEDPCDESTPEVPQYLYDGVSFRNGGIGLFNRDVGSLHYHGFSILENGGGEIFIKKLHVDYTMNPMFLNTLLVGSLDPFFDSSTDLGKYAITSPQLEHFYVKNVTIVNYGTTGALQGCADCIAEVVKQGGWTQRYEGVTWVKTIKRILWVKTKKEIIWDLDGSVGGVPDSMIVRSYGSIVWPDVCKVLPSNVFDDSIRCGGSHSDARVRRLVVEGVTPYQLSFTDLEVGSLAGSNEYFFLPQVEFGWVFPVVTGSNRSYSFAWADSGISAYSMTLHYSDPGYLLESMSKPNRYDETLHIDYTPNYWDIKPYSYGVTYGGKRKIAPRNQTRLSQMADAAWDKHGNTISVIVATKGAFPNSVDQFGLSLDPQQCPPVGCPVPPVPQIGTPMLWSRESSWPHNQVPISGQSVKIDSNMWIVMDISPPTLGSLTINGRLSFLSNASHPRSLKLRCKDIAVWGSMEIVGWGGVNESFVGDATVEIYGQKGASFPVRMSEKVYLGSKVIAVSGTLSAKGTQKVTWMRLHSTVTMGDDTVVLDEQVDWAVGDQVILSPTGYFKYDGSDWSSKSTSNDEIFSIKRISSFVDSVTHRNHTRIVLDSPAKYTHLCTVQYGKSFCGAIGAVTKSVRFVCSDVDDPKSFSYMFGANIHVLDIPTSHRYGSVYFDNVEFVHFGKGNSDHQALKFQYSDYNHPPSSISNCAFVNSYCEGLYAEHSFNLTFENNVVFGNFGGGVYISPTNNLFKVTNNLVVGTRQLPSVLKSSYPWVRPIASFTIESPSGIVIGNLAAGSQDIGFCKCCYN